MITLALGKLEVDWGKNNFFKDHGCLFQDSDLKEVPTYYAGDDWPEGEPIVEFDQGFGKPLRELLDRLKLLGYTLKSAEHHYKELHKLHGIEDEILPFDTLRRALADVDVTRVSGNYGEDYDPGEFVGKEILDRLGLRSERYSPGGQFDHWEIDLLLENFSPYAGLRLLAENKANLDLDVTWDFSPLVETGWAAREEFTAGVVPDNRFLIVTEGSSDAKILEHAIALLRPHVADFFDFVDMEEGYPFSGSGNLYRFTKGLVSIGIQNNTVIVYDNDAEGVSKLDATSALTLPTNVRAMKLPELDDFKTFVTEGPTGRSNADINLRAAAIECYLDLAQPGLPEPVVRWSSFNNQAGVYQGELEHKTQFMKKFLATRPPVEGYDMSKVERILDALFTECVAIAERRLIARPFRSEAF